jgi:outer membrane protein OmpA-like peptidoglycan-associated protein
MDMRQTAEDRPMKVLRNATALTLSLSMMVPHVGPALADGGRLPIGIEFVQAEACPAPGERPARGLRECVDSDGSVISVREWRQRNRQSGGADDAATGEEVPTEEPVVEEAPAEEAPAEGPVVEEAPAEEPVVEEAPAAEVPAEEAPAEEAPAEEPVVEEVRPEEAPADEAPAVEATSGDAGADEAPAEEAPAEGPVVEEAPAEEPVVEEAPAAEVPAEEAPADEAPAVEATSGDAGADEAPAEEVPAEEPVVEEVRPEEAPADEAPAEEPVVEEVPAGEPVVEEAPAAEVPAEEVPADEAPAEEATSADAPGGEDLAGAGPEIGEAVSEQAPESGEPTPVDAETIVIDDPAETPPLDEIITEVTAGTGGTEAPAAAAAGGDGVEAAPALVETETVTDETARSSAEDVRETGDNDGDRKDEDRKRLLQILGAAAVGFAIGRVIDNDREVVEDQGDRIITRDASGQYHVLKDENELLRRPGSDVRTETFRDGSSRIIVDRSDGTQVVTIRDALGRVVRRTRLLPDGREVVLFDDTDTRLVEAPIVATDLPPARAESYDYGAVDNNALIRALLAANEDLAARNRRFSMRQVREDVRVRDLMPRVDLDVITFDTGSAAISPDQAQKLATLGALMAEIIRQNPYEMFLIEGHTDAVGSETSNLLLSDRRAESVALALTEYFDVPPENMVVQGYGEQFLKVPTDASERANRRAAVRRITQLLDQAQN